MTTNRPKQPWTPLVAEFAQRKKDKEFRAKRSALRAGSGIYTEFRAYSYVLPFLGEKASEAQRTALLRCMAALAEYPDIVSSGEKATASSVGQWVNRVAFDGKQGQSEPDSMVASRIKYLHTQDLEEAISSLRRIMAFADRKNMAIKLNPYQFVELFWYWGNGFTDASTKHRLSVLRDFYSTKQKENTDPQSSSEGEK
ncbi:type I-E CRISPR-associated protein Cse2/CasB [Corynebacterium ulcerans]|uniref:type I-E CRISPR-associated protein Cse2/CasB n=1 Tax=Corynebacterium ulcerans TaxID=65058 RepID=UPI00021415C4|nr:type I-E CRISPR-associated protein Cse2/CasB [Corynebacterium ulcerans]AEG82755.1 hypothetical protein CULC22_00034 [Corynebacterium ulcerans BR-AD22]AIT88021.1 CRISPR-associated protein [Corynebacterium ulcerans]ALD93782.1 CRISPR-associated protein [Corynebacterium ulcerans]NOL58843.1 type I-E CRISPR-associated protein Cse2/CasB [Corynebacterium ulcerans]NOM03370.1 type I-E CRISPR-associated protein Cse2/CasB [Corynebacterium ulcerans]